MVYVCMAALFIVMLKSQESQDSSLSMYWCAWQAFDLRTNSVRAVAAGKFLQMQPTKAYRHVHFTIPLWSMFEDPPREF